MNAEQHLVFHGLAVKKYAKADAIASLMGMDQDRVNHVLQEGIARGSVLDAGGKLTLSPTARVSLQASYSRFCSALRRNSAFRAAYEGFERLNVDLKALITDWQTVKIGGKLVPNDHSNEAHDERVMERLARLHTKAESVLNALVGELPRMAVYPAKLGQALDLADSGKIEWVSDAKIESYHTVWFELHEDLLCLMGEQRKE